jgi:hypothetical protein
LCDPRAGIQAAFTNQLDFGGNVGSLFLSGERGYEHKTIVLVLTRKSGKDFRRFFHDKTKWDGATEFQNDHRGALGIADGSPKQTYGMEFRVVLPIAA